MTKIQSRANLLDKLRAVLLKQRIIMFIAGLVVTGTVLALTWLGLSLIAQFAVLPVWLKLSLLAVSAGVTIFFFTRHALVKLFEGSIDHVAVALEQKHPDLQGRLIAAVQFARMQKDPGYSSELIEMTEQQAMERAGLMRLDEVVSYYPVVRTGRYLAGAAILGLLLLFLFPGFFSYSYEVYSNPTTEIAPPLAYKVLPNPASREWVKYQDITIGAAILGARIPDQAVIHYRLADGSWQSSEVQLKSLPKFVCNDGDSLSIGLTLRQVAKSLDYYVEAGRIKTEVQKIDVVDRPRVNNIQLAVFYPDYTGLAPTTLNENNGSFSAVVGSRVTMKIETNLPVAKADLVFDDKTEKSLTIEGKNGELTLQVLASQSYHIRLQDHLGELNPDPIEYYITAIPDEYPIVEVLYPGFDANLTDEMLLPLKVRISDDYGFTSLVMKYTVTAQGSRSEEHVAVLNFSDRIKTEGEVEFNWDLDQLNLFPGDYVQYHFEVADNDRITGPKISKSRQFIARIPSLDEVVAETEGENKERINQTQNLIQTGKDLVQRLKNAARKLEGQSKQVQRADWQQQKELEAIAEKNADMLQEIEKLAQNMDSSMEKMKDNALMSREIMEKMEQIQKLFEEVATPEMRDAQKKMMDALKQMDRQKLLEAMKQFELSQKEMMERLDRTLALLKKMQLEQKMEAMVRKAEDLVARQEQSNESTEKAPSDQLPQLSKPEEEIKQGLEDLKKEVAEMRQAMKDAQMEKSPEAQKFAEAVEKTDAEQNMQQMSQSLQQQQKSEASEQGKQASSKLHQMLSEMQQQQMAMKGENSEAVKRAMRRAIDDANYLSSNQESLLKEAAEISPQSMVMRDMAEKQQDLTSASNGLKNSIEEIGKQSPFIASELQGLIQKATQNMELATQQFDEKQGMRAVNEQRNAMINLNLAALRMMESLEQQSNCDKGGNCDKNMAKLEQMSQKQNELNQQTQQCNNPGQMKQGEGRQTLERLAGEQGSLRKSMEQLEREFGNSRQVLGRLDDIAKEMKEIEEDMQDGEIGPATTERQLRVYSRMLEATRSLQRKDFTEQRKANTASDNPVFLPEALSADMLNDRAAFEDRLKQFLGDKYPPQYEEQIKAYFRALLQVEKQNTPVQSETAPPQ
ncbi:MAG: hypothetical protein IPH75_00325 [bacterium]|nr:hypothetical protein [bacterium]